MKYVGGNQKFNVETTCMCLFLMIFTIMPPSVNSVIVLMISLLMILRKRNLKFRLETVSIILLLYIVLNAVSIIYSKNQSLVLKEVGTWLVFLLVMHLSKKVNIFESKICKYFFVGIIILNVLYIQQQFWGIEMTVFAPPTINCTAIINCMVVILIENRISLGITRSWLVERMIQVLCFFSIIISNARGIVLLLGVYYIYQVLFKHSGEKGISAKDKIRSIIGIIIIVIVVIYLLPRFWNDYFSSMRDVFSSSVYSNKVRLSLYSNTINYTLHNHFWLGVGAGNFSEYYGAFGVDGFYSNHSHNIFLQPFVELGILGLVLTVFMFIVFVRKALRLEKKKAALFLEVLIPFIVYGIVDYVWVDLRVGIVFFIFIGQMLHAIEMVERKRM